MQAQPLSNTAAETSFLFRPFLQPKLLLSEPSGCITGEGLC